MNRSLSLSLPDSPDVVAKTILKFLIPAFVCTSVYLFTLATVAGLHMPGEIISGSKSEIIEFIRVMGAFSLSSIPAAFVYMHLPDETVDVYHRIGKASILFMTVNIFVSAGLVTYEYHLSSGLEPLQIIGYWALSSAYVPGPYLGTLIGARWSR